MFTVSQSAAASVDTVLTYTVGGSANSGSDFAALTGTVTILAGSTSATINVATIDDALIEATEDVIVTLTGITAGDPQVTIDSANDDATITLTDNDSALVSIAATTNGERSGADRRCVHRQPVGRSQRRFGVELHGRRLGNKRQRLRGIEWYPHHCRRKHIGHHQHRDDR